MERFFLFPDAVRHLPEVDDWFDARPGELGDIARHWFGVLRACGKDVRELLHDKQPTACVGESAFAYVNVFKAHVNLGFFLGASLPDPDGLMEGTGKFMRHVKLGPGRAVDQAALERLVKSAYVDMRERMKRAASTR